MKNNDRNFYTSPEIHVIDIESKSVICTSSFDGQIEGTTEDDW